jgi:hypothetical protein
LIVDGGRSPLLDPAQYAEEATHQFKNAPWVRPVSDV